MASRLEPPALMNGSARPLFGRALVKNASYSLLSTKAVLWARISGRAAAVV